MHPRQMYVIISMHGDGIKFGMYGTISSPMKQKKFNLQDSIGRLHVIDSLQSVVGCLVTNVLATNEQFLSVIFL